MLLGRLLTLMFLLSLFSAAATGRMAEVSAAALSGAGDAVALMLQIGGTLALWSGVMELLRRSRLSDLLSRSLEPFLRRLYPKACQNREILALLAANMSANLLGLGNAATPPGLNAAKRMKNGENGAASEELCRLVILNACSIQILPTTAATLLAANGAKNPFEILPAVWIASVFSVIAGILAGKGFEIVGKRGEGQKRAAKGAENGGFSVKRRRLGQNRV